MADIAKELQKLKALVNQRQTTAIFSNKSNESTKLALSDAELYINDMTRKFSFTRAGVKNPIMIDAKTKAIENVEYLNGCKVEELEGLYEDVEQLKYDMEHHKHELMEYDVKMTEGLAVGGIPDIGFSLLDTSIWSLMWQTWSHKLNIVIDRCERDITTDHIFCFNISFSYNEVIHTISCEHDFSQYETMPTSYINLTLQSTIGVGNAIMSCRNGYWINFSVNIAEEDESKITTANFTINELKTVGKIKPVPPTTISKAGDVNVPGKLMVDGKEVVTEEHTHELLETTDGLTVKSQGNTLLKLFNPNLTSQGSIYFGKSAANNEGGYIAYDYVNNQVNVGIRGVGAKILMNKDITTINGMIHSKGAIVFGKSTTVNPRAIIRYETEWSGGTAITDPFLSLGNWDGGRMFVYNSGKVVINNGLEINQNSFQTTFIGGGDEGYNYIKCFNPNVVNQKGVTLAMGNAGSSNNSMTMRFIRSTNSNYLSLGFWGNDNILTIDTNNLAKFKGDVEVGGKITSNSHGHQLGHLLIDQPYIRYWKSTLSDGGKMYFQMGKNNTDAGGCFWMEYTYPGEMLFRFHSGNSMMRFYNTDHLIKFIGNVEMEKELKVAERLKVRTSEIHATADTYAIFRVNDVDFWSCNTTNDFMICYKQMNVRSDLDVDGAFDVDGNANVDGTLTVGGTLTVNGSDITFGSVHLQQTSTQLSMKLNDTDWMLCNNSNNQLQLYRKLIATKDIYVKNNIEFDGLFISKDGEYLKFSKGIKVNNDVEVGGKLTVEGEEFSVNNFYVHAIGTDYVDFSVGAAMFLDYNLTDHILHTGAKFTTVHAEIYNSLKVDKDVNILGTLTVNGEEFSPNTVYSKEEVNELVSNPTITVSEIYIGNNVRMYHSNNDGYEMLFWQKRKENGEFDGYWFDVDVTSENIHTTWRFVVMNEFDVYRDATFDKNVDVWGDLHAKGNLYIEGELFYGNLTINHKTNVFSDDIGCFCESTGEIYDGYKEITNTDCICQVKQSHGLNKKIVGIITGESTFASHGDVLVKLAAGCAPEVGDILCPDEDGYGKVASDSELMFMMMNAIPRPKITSLNVGVEGYAACFLV